MWQQIYIALQSWWDAKKRLVTAPWLWGRPSQQLCLYVVPFVGLQHSKRQRRFSHKTGIPLVPIVKSIAKSWLLWIFQNPCIWCEMTVYMATWPDMWHLVLFTHNLHQWGLTQEKVFMYVEGLVAPTHLSIHTFTHRPTISTNKT